MTARIIDGKALAARLQTAVARRVASLQTQATTPGLAVVLIGDDPASAIYVRNKVRACEAVGIRSFFTQLPENTSRATLLARVAELNADPAVHGILVQLPLPRQLDAREVVAAIAFDKDVDGLHPTNAGLTLLGRPHFRSCTPYGVMMMLESIQFALQGCNAVVIGRSNMVGKPMAMLLLSANATVTMCHSATRDLGSITRGADLIVAAAGRRNLVTADMVKPGAVVIDVGTNRTPEGKLAGDVDFANVREVASWISPVPGGVGPMTVAMLLVNTVEAAERSIGMSAPHLPWLTESDPASAVGASH
jgi:methylenetetrahydrofolate dehydrogenase (NADP+) / methenyltetrahydrofolate cyclohydrolase